MHDKFNFAKKHLIFAAFCIIAFNSQKISAQTNLPCTPPLSGMVAFWTADGNAVDINGANNGALINGATFTDVANGKAREAFSFDGIDDAVQIPDSAALRPTNLTIEGWFNFASSSGARILVAKSTVGSPESYIVYYSDGTLNGAVGSPGGLGTILTVSFTPAVNTWYHIAYTFDDASDTQKLFINGIQVVTGTTTHSVVADASPLLIGAESNGVVPANFFSGKIDEVALLNRALAPNANELSLAVTNTTAHQNSNFAFTATITNHGLQTANDVVLNATLPANLNFISADAGCTFDAPSRRVTCLIGSVASAFAEKHSFNDLAPTAAASRNIVVQPTVSGVLQTPFTVTATEADNVLANNFFGAAVNVLPPTAALDSISGRVTTQNGAAISGALLTLADSHGVSRSARTNAFGFYRFENLAVGEIYVLSVMAKNIRFQNPTRVIFLGDEITDVHFIAEDVQGESRRGLSLRK